MNQAMPKMEQPQVIRNMPEEEYHALPRFSSSGIKDIMVSANTFWKKSWMNEDKEVEEKKSFNVGSAYHKRILEGKDAFNSSYAVKPECDRRTKIGKEIYAQFKSDYPDAKEIDERLRGYIEEAANRIHTKPELNKYFKGGEVEIVVLWDDEETGVPMKSRLDCVHDDRIVDLKTFSNPNGKPLRKLIMSHIAQYNYYVQAAVYHEAAKQGGWDIKEFWFFFQQSGRDNNAIPVNFSLDGLLYDKGKNEAVDGIRKFADMYRKFGTGEWFDEVETFEPVDEDFPLWIWD